MAALHRIVDSVQHKGLGRLTDRSPAPTKKTPGGKNILMVGFFTRHYLAFSLNFVGTKLGRRRHLTYQKKYGTLLGLSPHITMTMK